MLVAQLVEHVGGVNAGVVAQLLRDDLQWEDSSLCRVSQERSTTNKKHSEILSKDAPNPF